VKAIFDLGKSLADFTLSTMQAGFDLAGRLLEAALAAGKAVGDVLATAIQQGFLIFRRTLHALLSRLGPIGSVLDWLLTQTGNLATLAWRETMNALQMFGRSINEALDWAKAKSAAVLKQIVEAAEAAGALASDLIGWAMKAGDAALSLVGEVLYRAGHTVDYILLWLEKDVLEGVRAMVKGLLQAGATIADLMVWAVQRTVEAMTDVVKELIAFGATLAQIVADTIMHPDQALQNLVRAFEAAGRTLKDIVNAAIVQPTEDAARKMFAALKAVGKSAADVALAALAIGGSAIALAVTLILEWFPGSYRQLSADEMADAQKVFGGSIELPKVRVAVKSLPVDLIETLNGNRPFTTMYLLNFSSWAQVDRPTLIHELTHVWQGVVNGPIYMIEAIHGQMTGGYNYGYTEDNDGRKYGEGAQDDLVAADGDFDHFNREQQAQIVEHYFMRRFFDPTKPDGTAREYTEWQPYAQQVFA